MIPLSSREGDQAAIDSDSLIFTRSKSAELDTPITIVQDEPIKRTMSSVVALGLHENSEWDNTDSMTTAINMSASSVQGIARQQNVIINPTLINRAKQEPNANPYTKVLCKFKAGENEVSLPPFSPQRLYASLNDK